jgi:hypothetical protein
MRRISTGGLLAFALLGCSSDAPPGAKVGVDKTLDSPLAQLQKVSLLRAGDAFTLAGYDTATATVRWGRVALDGTLTQETSFPFPLAPVVGPVFAATQKTSPGDQLVALAIVNSTTVTGGFDLVAVVHTAGAPAPASPVVLNASDSIPAGADPTTMQLTAGASATGTLGFVAWGTRFKGKPIFYWLLPGDAATTGSPSTFLNADVPANVPEWDCLAAQGHPTGYSFAAVTFDAASGTSLFHTIEVDAAGNVTSMEYPLSVTIAGCQIVGAPTPAASYFMAFQGEHNGLAIDFATYYPPIDPSQPGPVDTKHPVMSSALFGSPANLPIPAWVSSAGPDIVIGLTRRGGPQVVRFRYDAVQHGSTLQLRSANGSTGPVAAWVGNDAVYATYTDFVSANGVTTTKRYFMRIDSPVTLP